VKKNIHWFDVRHAEGLLRDTERIVREDPVATHGVHLGSQYDFYCHMEITSERVFFKRPRESHLAWFLPAWAGIVPYMAAPNSFWIELARIKRLWKWKPEFSGSPMIQFEDDYSFYFHLVEGKFPRLKPAAIEGQREHYEALETVWHATRSRAPVDAEEHQ
jgi:hypothetical protein